MPTKKPDPVQPTQVSEPIEPVDLTATIESIPARKWFVIRKRLDATFEEVTSDALMTMVAAYQHATGCDWDQALDMDLASLTACFLDPEDAEGNDARTT